jgi:phosphatidylserine/phosphatidylglycerophosphate/cardiolipin synthase-like enzyme
MNFDALRLFGADELDAIAQGLLTGRLGWPPTELALKRLGIRTPEAFVVLNLLAEGGHSSTAVRACAAVLGAEKASHAGGLARVELVWSGPDLPGHPSRDTGTVVRELFTRARDRILVVGYAVHRGIEIFEALARRMEEDRSLMVRMCLDIQRARGDTTRSEDLVARFAERFRTKEWPGTRLPEIYYDPRSLDLDPAKRATLHAKCVVVDGATCLITSANFTPAAQGKNIELGVTLDSATEALRIESYIQQLVERGELRRVAL